MKRVVRARAEYMGGSRIRYHYRCGHYRTEELRNGSPGPRGKKPMSPPLVKRMAKYWADGVNVPPCPTCARRGAES